MNLFTKNNNNTCKEVVTKENVYTYTKCIIKTAYLLKLDIHQHIMIPKFNNIYKRFFYNKFY